MFAPEPKRSAAWLPYVLTIVLVGLTVALLYRGWGFYRLSLEDRVEHVDFRKLRPSGAIGNGYGWIAALLIVLNLSYLIRRRFGSARLGSMRIWLDIHVATGLCAALLATFHSAFQMRTVVTQMSAASLGVVVLTGLVGRFLYALTPSADRERLRDAIEALEAQWPGHRDEVIHAIDALPGPIVPPNASLLRSLFAIPSWRRVGSARRAALAVLIPRSTLDKAQRRAARDVVNAAAAEAGSSGMTALLRSWRGMHRFFAILMLVSVGLHGGIAWYFGYRWIFG